MRSSKKASFGFGHKLLNNYMCARVGKREKRKGEKKRVTRVLLRDGTSPALRGAGPVRPREGQMPQPVPRRVGNVC